MKRNFLRLIIFTIFYLNASFLFAQIYKAPSYTVEERVDALLDQMTLEEKIGQMTQSERGSTTVNDVSTCFLGSILSGGGSVPTPNTPQGWADMYDTFQASALSTRLEIPLLYGVDAVHGHNNVYGATIFPHNIGLGATWDADLIEQIGVIVAKEVAATGVDWTFAPCFAVARNERWGRTYEGFGEDPEIGELFADRYIKGLQGLDMTGGECIIACAKHWVGDGGTTDGIDQGDTACSDQELRDIHIAPYIPAINAGAGTVMVSYSSWNSEPLHGHKYLITDVLKTELGFNGFVVSDWNGIDKIDGTFSDRVMTAVNAGIDMFMQPNNWKTFISTLKSLVDSGDVSMSRIDDAVRRILRVKFTFGLFENPYTDRTLTNDGSFGSAEHRTVAREAVRKSLVLLKNQNNILPLSASIDSIFVAGKNADNIGNQCGGWTITWQGKSGDITTGTTILEGIRNMVSSDKTITFSENGTGATGHDVAIVVIGETPYAEGSGNSSNLSLDATDQTCLNNVLSAGIPVIVVLVSGRPRIVTNEITNWDAFVSAWLPGTEGEGVAEVLFGNYNFSGKLPCSWPSSMTQLPINYGDLSYDPLFSYGFGLTYEGWTPPTTPLNPSGLTAEAVSFSEVNLAWADNSDNEIGFKIERKLATGVYANVASVAANVVSYADSELSSGATYYYRIKAYNGLKESDYCDEVSVTTLSAPIPVKPSDLTAEAVSFSEVNLAWADNSDNEIGFKIERKLATGVYTNVASVAANVVSYADSELSGGTIYYYRIKAYNVLRESDYCDEVSVTTLSTPVDVINEKLIAYNNLINPEKGQASSIAYVLTYNEHVLIKICNLAGEVIRTVVDADKDSGVYAVTWDGKNDSGSIVASGTYLVLMKTDSTKLIKKIIIRK